MPDEATSPVTLRVFPNSGHQYFVVRLKDLLPNRDEDFLSRLARQNREPWKPWSEYTPWILYQYAVINEAGDDVPVLKMAVETNLGLPSRGLVFDAEDTPVADPPDQDTVVLPYASMDEASIQSDYKHGIITLRQLPNKEGRPLDMELRIHWPKRGGFDPVDVDLIVDLGNTRTVALLLETPGQDPSTRRFEKRVSILRFVPRGSPYEPPSGVSGDRLLFDDCAIIDSWMLLHRTQFAHLEPPKNTSRLSTHYIPDGADKDGKPLYAVRRHLPHTFVELSPAIIGGGKRSPDGVSKIISQVPLDRDARFQLSSPKRYAWDDEQQGFRGGTFWRQIPNDTDEQLPDFFDDLGGLFRYFMDPSGQDWDIDAPPGDREFRGMPFPNSPASYPRNAAVCWFALSIFEVAHRQINSERYLALMGRETLPRRLRRVRVTFPTGWTSEERERYLQQWERAIKLFTLTRFEDHRPVSLVPRQEGGNRPVLTDRPLDEAVCSQLPILYSDVTALRNDVEGWIDLFGREDGVTVMNVDIGGGTTDVAILNYEAARLSQSDPTVRAGAGSIVPRLLFRDGYTIAGDVLVKRIIEEILLPVWLKVSSQGQYEYVPDAKSWIKRLFLNPGAAEFSNVDPRASTRMMRVVRLVFIPIVNLWLTRFGSAEADSGPVRPVSIDEALRAELIDKNTLNDLNQLVDAVVRSKCENGSQWEGPAFAFENIELACDRAALEACVDSVFGELFDSLAPLAGRFDIDLAIISGKPSELPRIRDLLVRRFPLLPQRIIHVKNFAVGSWYPYRSFEDGRIVDAKTCTVVGAALYEDITNGHLEGFSIIPEENKRVPRRYTWGIVTESGATEDFHKHYLFTPADYPPADDGVTEIVSPPKTFTLPVNCRIGRQLTRLREVRAEPVYELRWIPSNTPPVPGAVARVTLRWTSKLGEGEKLELVSVESHPDFPMVLPEDVSMRLNTLLATSFWLDEPRFEAENLFA